MNFWITSQAKPDHPMPFTPEDIINQVEKDAEEIDTCWVFAPEDLVKVISEPEFPQDHADKIKMHILNIYTKWIHNCLEEIAFGTPWDYCMLPKNATLAYCYHTLDDSSNKKYAKAKREFRNATILFATISAYWDWKQCRQDISNKLHSRFRGWQKYLRDNSEIIFSTTIDNSLNIIHIGPDVSHWEEKIKQATESYFEEKFGPKNLSENLTPKTGN